MTKLYSSPNSNSGLRIPFYRRAGLTIEGVVTSLHLSFRNSDDIPRSSCIYDGDSSGSDRIILIAFLHPRYLRPVRDQCYNGLCRLHGYKNGKIISNSYMEGQNETSYTLILVDVVRSWKLLLRFIDHPLSPASPFEIQGPFPRNCPECGL